MSGVSPNYFSVSPDEEIAYQMRNIIFKLLRISVRYAQKEVR